VNLSNIGGLFAIATFFHFAFDWILQSEADAVAKSGNWKVRLVHASIYSALMALTFYLLLGRYVAGLFFYLQLTHFLEDTYWLPMWWMKHIRKANGPYYAGFNLTLLVVIDQIIHLATILLLCFLVA
jgi:hypothetical protein